MTEEQKSFYPDSRAENERLSFAIQAAEIGTWEVDPVDQLMRWDDYTRLLFGATQTGLLPYDQALQYIHPDDHAQVIEAVGWSLNPASNGRLKIDFRIIDSNSQLRWLRCQGKGFFLTNRVKRSGFRARPRTSPKLSTYRISLKALSDWLN